ncbi:MAG: winged helix DNA-binding protein [Dehalococcoidia bacterium]|nr:MAG: winged helix DNA-binding protein [Dehalococcoidia bacterium]
MRDNSDISFGLWQMLNRSRQAIVKLRQKELNQYDISMSGLSVIRTIMRLGEKATVKHISQQLFFEYHSVRELIVRLDKEGLLRKTKDPRIKNLVRIEVTDKGEALYRKSMNKPTIKQIMSALNEDEQLQLWFLLSKIRDRCVKKLKIKGLSPYPPSNPTQYVKE